MFNKKIISCNKSVIKGETDCEIYGSYNLCSNLTRCKIYGRNNVIRDSKDCWIEGRFNSLCNGCHVSFGYGNSWEETTVGEPVGGPVGDPVGAPTGNPVGNPVGAPTGSPVGNPVGGPVGNPECVVCTDKSPNYIIVPCFHLCLCQDCAPPIEKTGNCPICRGEIKSINKVFI